MEYVIGDKVKNYDDYLNNCLSFKYLHNNLKPGDHIIMYIHTKIVKMKFISYVECSYKISSIKKFGDWLKNHKGCGVCKGKLKIEGVDFNLCTGYTHEDYSNIYNIIKNTNLDDKLFEI